MRTNKNKGAHLIHDIWEWGKTKDTSILTRLDIIVLYIEEHDLDPAEIGEIISTNKEFVEILKNDMIRDNVFTLSDEEESTSVVKNEETINSFL